jgi:hypothetical protein
MAFNRENLSIVVNNVKAGVVPSQWLYWNEASDTVTSASFFTDGALRVGDQIDVLLANFTAITRYRVSAVSDDKKATVIASATTTYNVGGVSTRTDAGAVDVTNEITLLVSTAGTPAITLADGVVGQRKIIKFKTDAGTMTLTPAHLADGATIEFDDAGDVVELVFADSNWQIIANEGCTVG